MAANGQLRPSKRKATDSDDITGTPKRTKSTLSIDHETNNSPKSTNYRATVRTEEEEEALHTIDPIVIDSDDDTADDAKQSSAEDDSESSDVELGTCTIHWLSYCISTNSAYRTINERMVLTHICLLRANPDYRIS